nr:integrase, catalytic region, zinc finger, CCHC-type, peptidase aspartic, catalytic [Tanacetum cinerariifolium]
MKEDKIKNELEEIETINIELDHRVTKLIAENEHLKQTYKQLYDSIKSSSIRSKEQCDDLINQVNLKSAKNFDLNASLQEKILVITALKDNLRKLKGKAVVDDAVTSHPIDPEILKVDVAQFAPKLRNNKTAHSDYLRHTQEQTATFREIVKQEKLLNPLNNSLDYACKITTTAKVPLRKPIALESDTLKPVVVQIVLWYLDSGCSKHMTGDRSQLTNFVDKFLGTIKFDNDHVAKIIGYGDYQIENVLISRVYFVEGRRHNLFSVGKFCYSDLEVSFRQHICFIRNLKGVDLLTGSRGNNPYTLSHDGVLSYIENLGKLQPKADISIFIGYAPTKKAFQIYNRCTRRIIKTIHVDFDELTVMASQHSSSGPVLHEMAPATISLGLVPNPTSSTSVDHPAPEVIAPIAEVVAPEPAASTGLPSLTAVDQDAPLPSNSQKTTETQSSIIPGDVEDDNHDLDVTHMNNDSFFVDTSMVEKSKLDEDKERKAVDPSYYRGMIGTLLYLTASRPNL